MSNQQHGLIDAFGQADQTRRIIPFDERHVDRAAELWETRFGTDDEHMDQWLDDARIGSEAQTQGFAATIGTRLVGFGIAAIAGPEYARDYVHVDAPIDPWETTGILHMLVVDAEHEGQGIGSDLVWHRLQWLATEGAGGALGISWHRENNPDSRPLFEKHGFEAVATVPGYYQQLDGEVLCVDCDGQCRCDATIYRKPLNGVIER